MNPQRSTPRTPAQRRHTMPPTNEIRHAPAATESSRRNDALTGQLYRLHGFKIIDADGVRVGWADWIWADETTGRGEFIGVGLRFLRGKARAVPVAGARVDWQSSTIRLAYRKDAIVRAARFSIDRLLTDQDRAGIHWHYNAIPTSRAAAKRVGYQVA